MTRARFLPGAYAGWIIGWSQPDSEGFSPGTPVFLPPQNFFSTNQATGSPNLVLVHRLNCLYNYSDLYRVLDVLLDGFTHRKWPKFLISTHHTTAIFTDLTLKIFVCIHSENRRVPMHFTTLSICSNWFWHLLYNTDSVIFGHQAYS